MIQGQFGNALDYVDIDAVNTQSCRLGEGVVG